MLGQPVQQDAANNARLQLSFGTNLTNLDCEVVLLRLSLVVVDNSSHQFSCIAAKIDLAIQNPLGGFLPYPPRVFDAIPHL